jgi:hypothetical protein
MQLAILLCIILAGCGYFDSVFNTPESTATTLSGTVSDSLCGSGIPDAVVTLSGSRDTTVRTDSRGYFQFLNSTTGTKQLSVTAAGYFDFSTSLDLSKDTNQAAILLVRKNSAPEIDTVFYPGSSSSVPLRIRFSWTVSDSDLFFKPSSIESLRYEFYLGNTYPPPLLAADICPLESLGADSFFIINEPETASLATAAKYYYKIVVKDIFKDSAVHTGSFDTRAAFNSVCPSEMALVEMESLSFCMDKTEFTNQEYRNIYPTSQPSLYSPYNNSPVTLIPFNKAGSACLYLGKRLCTIEEWQAASGGYQRLAYPYGDKYDSAICHTNDPMGHHGGRADTVPTCSLCVSPYGIYDLSGNVAEWVLYRKDVATLKDTITGNNIYFFTGGYWASQENSGTLSLKSTPWENQNNVGFRCCKEIQ